MTPAAPIARVLVAMDFDEASAAALRMVVKLAHAWQAEVTLFHSETEDVPAYFTTRQIDELETEQQQSRSAVADELRAYVAPHAAETTVLIGTGPPQDAILRIAPQFDLIALGTHRRHGPQRWWLGSVAEAVVRRSPRPVLVVPAGAHDPSGGRAPHILSAGAGVPAVEAWVDTLRSAFGGRVTQSAGIGECSPDRLRDADLIVFPLSASQSHAQVKAVVHLLKECLHPVLFVPYSEESQRSPS